MQPRGALAHYSYRYYYIVSSLLVTPISTDEIVQNSIPAFIRHLIEFRNLSKVFPGHTYHPLASLSDEVPIVSCSGLTKRFLVPGWRTGWIILHDRNGVLKPIKKGLVALSQKIMGGTP